MSLPLQVWLRQPLTDLEAISGRHDVVEALTEDGQLRSDLRTLHLRGGCCAQPWLPLGGGCIVPACVAPRRAGRQQLQRAAACTLL